MPLVEGEIVTEIRELARRGVGSKTIARAVGVARNTVRRVQMRPRIGVRREKILLTAAAPAAVAAETGPSDAGSMHAAIVFGHNLDVLVMFGPVLLVLNPEVRKGDAVVEVRQVVLARPLLDLAVVTIMSAVAVRATTIVLLQPFLVFALELLLEDDAADFAALVPDLFLFAQLGAIQLRIVRQLARPADAGDEVLAALVGTLAAVCFQ